MSAAGGQRPRRSDLRRRERQELLQGVEQAHRADILTYSSGHLSPYSLSWAAPHWRPEEPIWEVSEYQDADQKRRDRDARMEKEAKETEANVEKMTEAMYDFTLATTLQKPNAHQAPGETPVDTPCSAREEDERSRGGEEEERRRGARRLRPALDASELFLVKPRDTLPVATKLAVAEEAGQDRYWFTRSHLAGLTRSDQLRMMQRFDRRVLKRQDLKERKCMRGGKAAEWHERKLKQELRKLPVQNWPSRERLGVFSDIFDDVCDGSPVFGSILREIKAEYDLYLNFILSSRSTVQDMSGMAPLEGLGGLIGAMELEEAGKEVSFLGEEARKALAENDRVRNEYQRAQDRVMGIPEEKGVCKGVVFPDQKQTRWRPAVCCIDQVQPKRRQVWNMWEEVQTLQKEIKEKMVSTITTSATERCIRDSKAEIMRLLAFNDRLKSTNKDLEQNISMVLNREKVSEEIRTEVWDKIWNALRHEDE